MPSARTAPPLIAILAAASILAMPSPASAQGRVPVVSSAAPKWTAATAWKIDPAPMLEIGSVDGAEPYLFHNPSGVLKLADGRIVVADMGSSQVRFYDARGKHLKTIGRSGDGPGEYRQISGLRRMNGDSMLVVEFERASVTTTDGKHVRVIRPASIPGSGMSRPYTWFSDASYISMDWPQGGRRTGNWIDSAHVALVNRDGVLVRSLGTHAAVHYAFKEEVAMPVQFAPLMAATAGTNEYFMAYPETYRIDVFRLDGTLKRTITRAWKPTPVTAADIEEYGNTFVNALSENGSTSPQFRAFRQKRLDQTTFAKQMPAFGPLRVDTEGNLWVQDGRPVVKKVGDGFGAVNADPTRFDVFDRAGVWLGSIVTPARLRVMDIGKDYIAGSYVGDDDIETVRLYRLRKPAAR